MSQEGPRFRLLQIPHGDLDGVVNVFQALVKANIPSSEWHEILADAQVAGDPDLSDKLHDYLMENGEKILTKEDLIFSIEKLKQAN